MKWEIYMRIFQCFSLDINHPVTLTNIPSNGLTVQENMAVGTSLYTFTYLDVDPDDKTWSISYDNDEASEHFSLDPDSKYSYSHTVKFYNWYNYVYTDILAFTYCKVFILVTIHNFTGYLS